VIAGTAAAVALAGGGEAFWICVPAALLLSAWSRTVAGVVLWSVAVVGGAAAPTFASASLRPEP
jgi:hypothetical protein